MSTDLTDRGEPSARTPIAARQVGRITRLEYTVAAVTVVVLTVLVIAEPDVLEAPFESGRTFVFTFAGTALAAVALVLMLQLRVPPVVRVLVLGAPFVAVSWWLISPFFIDDVVNDDFATSIAAADSDASDTDATTVPSEPGDTPPTTAQPETAGPTLLGSGQFVGLAGHDGTGDAGFFTLDDGAVVLRLENLDIQNGPDLRLYVVRGVDQTSPGDDSLYLGGLRGNVGNQTYDLPADFSLTPGGWTVLVWCEAFSVEFVAATVTIT